MARKFTTQLMDMIDEGLLSEEAVLNACLSWMSEDDVREMMFANDFVEDTDDWDEEPDVDEAQEWHDFDPDC